MPREYRRIGQYEKEIIKLKEKGLTKRENGEGFGISKDREKGVLQMKRRREEKKREDKKDKYGIGETCRFFNTTVLLHTKRALNRASILFFPQSEPQKKGNGYHRVAAPQ